MKRRLLAILLCLSMLLSVASCAVVKGDLEQIQDGFTDIMDRIQSADREGILSLMSEQAKGYGNIELEVDGLIDYVKGVMMSFFLRFSRVTNDEDSGLKEYRYCYQLSTTGKTYRIYIYEVVEDESAPHREGICSIYVIDKDEDISGGDYCGDGLDTPGIHIGLVNWEAVK